MPIAIDKPSLHFNTVLYTGNGGSNRGITGYGFAPDFIWHKSRSNSYSHYLFDKVRGVAKGLFSNSTSAEDTTSFTTSFNSFDSDGFTVSQITSVEMNQNSVTYANWGWKANGAGVSNTAGTISSTVSANTTSGFSIVSYTGNGTSGATIGHGLGAVPKMMIVKQRAGISDWRIYHVSMGNTNILEFTTAAQAANLGSWNNTTPTSSVFSVGNSGSVNSSGATHIAYCFAEVKGYSKFSSYTGNGSADGTFVYTGFKPAFILVKRSDSTGSWYLQDNVRNQNFNGDPKTLQPDTSSSESTIGTWSIDNLSNGFKIRESNAAVNASGGTYIYMCFAQNPFVSSKGIACTAR